MDCSCECWFADLTFFFYLVTDTGSLPAMFVLKTDLANDIN